ncbi:hypothetical protein B597_017680 [Stutzerimonas stutzeri KOS6]|uniref:Uncharacterized protein n=1 Tax=Stutzerimonas stutzeri KOS6 TaxID=1218352 RepID=A0A061JK69_STUST|nr:hypothetical protein B597_017680 [Stutzerimonas stutzeri KOS6]
MRVSSVPHSPAQSLQLLDLVTGLPLPVLLLPVPVALACRRRARVVCREKSVIAQFQQHVGLHEGRLPRQAAQLDRQRNAAGAGSVQLVLFVSKRDEHLPQ